MSAPLAKSTKMKQCRYLNEDGGISTVEIPVVKNKVEPINIVSPNESEIDDDDDDFLSQFKGTCFFKPKISEPEPEPELILAQESKQILAQDDTKTNKTNIQFLKGWTINIDKIPQYASFKSTFEVTLDYKLLKLIYDSDDPIYTEDRKQLLLPVLNKINKTTNKLKINHSSRFGLGRFYADESISPICVSRHIKHTLFQYLDWIDLDMIKGHPSMLLSVAKNNNIPLPAFEYYLQNFDNIVIELSQFYSTKEHLLSRDNIKDIFNMIIYGGGLSTWVTKMNKDGIELKTKKYHKIVQDFQNECRLLMDIVYKNNQALAKRVQGKCENEYELKARVMSYFCGTLENEILYVAYKFLIKCNAITPKKEISLEYDGLCFKRPEYMNLDEIISSLNQHITKKLNIDINFKFKSYDPVHVNQKIIKLRKEMKIEKVETFNERIAVESDKQASDILYERLKDDLIYCESQLFYKNKNVWICGKKVDDYILNFIFNSNIVKADDKGKETPFCENLKSAKNIREAIYSKINTRDDAVNIYEKFHSTTKGRIAFKDGVLDFIKNKFYEWNDIDFEYYTVNIIDRNFAEYYSNPNEVDISYIQTQIIDNLFGGDATTALQFFARGIAGHTEDKHLARYIGNRDCGKGVFYDLMKSAFDNYVGVFEASNLLYERNNDGEKSKKMYWMLDLQFMRIAISQEMPQIVAGEKQKKIDGVLLKKICSGGDTIKARRNYDIVDTNFKVQCRPIMMCNDSLEVQPRDALEKCFDFHSAFSFKSQSAIDKMRVDGVSEIEISSYKIAEPDIKPKCQTEAFGNAMVVLLLRNYINHEVTMNTNYIDDSAVSVKSVILKDFEITKYGNDRVTNTFMNEWFKNHLQLGISKKKFVIELLSFGIKTYKNTGVRGYEGIKYIGKVKYQVVEDDEC